MALAEIRSIDVSHRTLSAAELEDFEQELIDQYALACAASGVTDSSIAGERMAVVSFTRFLGRPIWTTTTNDVDKFLVHQRKVQHLAHSTIKGRVCALARFFEFIMARYQADIHAVAGHGVSQPVDEFNKPGRPQYRGIERIPPSDNEVNALFTSWGESLPLARKYLSASRDYLAASLWRRCGLRISETVMLDIRDWRPDLGEFGKIHVRFGKGSMGRGPKIRLVPAINGVNALLTWWLTDVRHQFGDDYDDPDAPLLPSERHNKNSGRCARVGDNALRHGFGEAVHTWLPDWDGRPSPHVLRHYCASSLYMHGMGIKAVQDLLGHEWLSTTTGYIHVHDDHIEASWRAANARTTARLTKEEE